MSREYHKKQAAIAREIYIESRTPDADAEDWRETLREVRRSVGAALRASDYLRDVSAAVRANGKHARIFRHIVAPPMSQDQFALCYPDWKKSTEKQDGPKTKPESAMAVAQAMRERRLKHLRRGYRPAENQLVAS